MRAFLKMRDTAEVYAPVREKHSIGIPALVVDDEIYLVQGPEHAAELVETLHLLDEAE